MPRLPDALKHGTMWRLASLRSGAEAVRRMIRRRTANFCGGLTRLVGPLPARAQGRTCEPARAFPEKTAKETTRSERVWEVLADSAPSSRILTA